MQAYEKLSYPIEGVVSVTGMSRSRIYGALKDGSLLSFKAGRRRMVSRAALSAFISKLEKESAPKARRKVRA